MYITGGEEGHLLGERLLEVGIYSTGGENEHLPGGGLEENRLGGIFPRRDTYM